MVLKVGDEAPLFCVPNQDGIEICLRDLRGSYVVLYFYPKDLTPGCTTEACDFSASLSEFLQYRANIFGISPDSVHSHQKFIAKESLSVNLLSDTEHEVCQSYGVWGEKQMYGKTYYGVHRTTFLINPEGKIDCIWEKVKVQGHIQEVLNTLKRRVSQA